MNEFLDSYKHLEKLCNEIYNQNNGVSQYISHMESLSGFNSMSVPGWNKDYRRLKEVRHIRNSMVHDASDDGTNYSEKDVKFLNDFYQRIMDGSDPITMFRFYNQASEIYSKGKQEKPISNVNRKLFNPEASNGGNKKKSFIGGIVGGIVGFIFLIGLLIMLLIYVLNRIGFFVKV